MIPQVIEGSPIVLARLRQLATRGKDLLGGLAQLAQIFADVLDLGRTRIAEDPRLHIECLWHGLRRVHGRQPIPRLRGFVNLVGIAIGHWNTDLIDQTECVVDQAFARPACRGRCRQNPCNACWFGRASRRCASAGRGVVLGHRMVVSSLDHNTAIVFHCHGQVVDRIQDFAGACVIRSRPRGARIV